MNIYQLANDSIVDGNRIDAVNSASGPTVGLHINDSFDVVVKGNTINSAYYGINYNSSTGKYMDNLTGYTTVPFTGGTAVGIND
jgi:hypothetical protein